MCTRHATARAQTRLRKRQAQAVTANVGGFKSLCLQRRGEPRLKLCPGLQFPNQIFTSTRGTRRSPRRRRAAPRAQHSAPRGSAISPRRVSRKTAALRRQSCGTEGTRVLDLRPRSHCRAGLSFAADARAYSELGSHAKTGL